MNQISEGSQKNAGGPALVSVITGILILGVKFYAYFVTGSNAILSDALESIVNVVTSSFALYTIYLGTMEADADHHYGHSKAEFFSAGLEGGLVFLAGGVILGHALRDLWIGEHELQSLDTGLLLIIAASFGNGALGYYLKKKASSMKSPALAADAHHILSDFYTSAGLIAGIAAVWWTGWIWLDTAIAVGIGVYLLFNGVMILRRSVHGLMDGVSPETMEMLTAAVERARMDQLIRPHKLRARESGNLLWVDMHAVVPSYLTVKEWHDQEVAFTERLSAETGRQVDLMMHKDPCIPADCRHCRMKKCPIRSEKYREDYQVSGQILLEDIRHPFEQSN